jgi:hypothetical protein
LVQATTTRPKITATTDGEGVVSHAAARLLADVADAAGVPAAVSEALAGCGCAVRVSTRDGCSPIWRRCSPTAAKRSVTWRVLRYQPTVFGPVAATATAWRMLDAVDDAALARVRDARAQARERAWLLRADAGRDLPCRPARPVAGTGPVRCSTSTPPWSSALGQEVRGTAAAGRLSFVLVACRPTDAR